MKISIGGYNYYSKRSEAEKQVKSSDDIVAFELGLGWYIYSKEEYEKNPRKKIFGF